MSTTDTQDPPASFQDLASLKNQFLVAMPNVVAGEFDHTVTFLCEHSPTGAMGLVVNRPTHIKLRDVLKHIGIEDGGGIGADVPVYWGGPVQPERGFVLHNAGASWDSTLSVSERLSITTSKDILVAISEGKGPSEYIVTLGYAGWSEGQLESEILHNSWLHTPADSAIIFTTPAPSRWAAAARLLGVDPLQLTGEAGHA